MRDRSRVDQGAVGGLRRDRAPAGHLAIDVGENTGARFALAQRAHVRDPAGHVEAGVAVHDADAPAAARLARHHERGEIIPPPAGRHHLDSHAPRIGGFRGVYTVRWGKGARIMDTDARGFPLGDLRVSDADRDRALSELCEAFQVGRITADEFDQRSGQVLAARTGKELAALLADLPLNRALANTAAPPPAAHPPL